MKKLITLGVLALIVGGLIATFFILRNRPPKEPEYVERPGRIKIDRFEVEQVQKMVLEGGGRTLTIERTGEDEWKIDSPYEIRLDPRKVEDIAYSFSGMYAETMVEEDVQDLSKYGLEEPAQVATGYLDDGTSRVYHLGDRTPTGNTYYLKPEDSSTVYAVWMNHGLNFSTTLTELRYTKMPQIDYQAIRYLYLKRPGLRDLEIQMGPPEWPERIYVFGSWYMSKPYQQIRGVDSEKLEEVMGGFGFSDIKGFVEDGVEDLATYGLDPPRGELHLMDESGAELHILIGDDVDDYTTYFRYPGLRNVYTLDRYKLDGMKPQTFSLTDKFAFIVNIDWIKRITISGPDVSHVVRIEHTGKDEYGSWISEFYVDDKQIEDKAFRGFYQAIIGVLADGEAEEKPPGDVEVRVVFDVRSDEQIGRPQMQVVLEYLDYNRDFFAVRRDGGIDIVTAKENVYAMLEAAAAIVVQ